MSSSPRKFEEKVDRIFRKMLTQNSTFIAWANREWVQELYAIAQIKRWETKGASEGKTWKPLNPRYVKWKKRFYEGSPGGGRKMMIASGRLLAGVLPPQTRPFSDPESRENFRKIVKTRSIVLATTVPYAKDASIERPFSKFSSATTKKWSKSFALFYVKHLRHVT